MPIHNKQLEPQARKLPAASSAPSTLSEEGAFYVKVVGGIAEGFYADDQGNEIQLTNNGAVNAAGGGGAVDSVNGQTGAVVLDADHIDDSSTTHKFASTAELSKLAGIAAGAEVNPDVVPQAEAEAGTATTERIWTAQRVKQAIDALAPGGGGGAVDSVNGQTGAVVLTSDEISEGTTNKYQAAKASSGEITAATETAIRAHSPADIKSYIDQHAASGGGAQQTYRILLPADATIAGRVAAATPPTGWTLDTADNDAEAQFGSSADSLVITWDSGLGSKLADITVMENNTATNATGGIKHVGSTTTNPSNVKTNSSQTKAVVQFSALSIQSTRDVYVLITLA